MTRPRKPGFCGICCAVHFLCDACDSGQEADTRALRIIAFNAVIYGAMVRHRAMTFRHRTDDENDDQAYIDEGYTSTGNGWR